MAFSWLLVDIEGSSPLWAVPFLRQMVLGYLWKLAKYFCELSSKQNSSMLFCWIPALTFLTDVPWPISWNKPFLPRSFSYGYLSNRIQTRPIASFGFWVQWAEHSWINCQNIAWIPSGPIPHGVFAQSSLCCPHFYQVTSCNLASNIPTRINKLRLLFWHSHPV